METKIIDGKEYTKVAIKDLSINGEKNDNSFSVDNLNNQNEISFDIKVDYNTDNNPATFTTSYLDDKNTKTNNHVKINSEVSGNTPLPTSSVSENSDKKNKINYWYYVILGIGLVGVIYFLFIK